MQVSDLTEVPDGYRVLIRRSKTDQTGEGQVIPIPRGYRRRPVAAVQAWLQAAGITEGLIFRSVHRGDAVRSWGLARSGGGGQTARQTKPALPCCRRRDQQRAV